MPSRGSHNASALCMELAQVQRSSDIASPLAWWPLSDVCEGHSGGLLKVTDCKSQVCLQFPHKKSPEKSQHVFGDTEKLQLFRVSKIAAFLM